MGGRIAQWRLGRRLQVTLTMMMLVSIPTSVVLAQDATQIAVDEPVAATETPSAEASDVHVSEATLIDDGPGMASDGEQVDPLPDPTSAAEREPNGDSLGADSPMGDVELPPGQQHEFRFTYHVTTPRTATVITVEMRLADGSPAFGWQVWAAAGQGDWVGDGAVAEVSESSSIVPDTAFALSIAVVAPADLVVEHSALLHVSSTVVLETGEPEPGVDGWDAQAGLTVILPAAAQSGPDVPGSDNEVTEGVDDTYAEPDIATPPALLDASTPGSETTDQVIGALQSIAAENPTLPSASATLVCDSSPVTEVGPTGYVELGCRYTAADGEDLPGVTASLVDVAGEGWKVAIGEIIGHDTRWGAAGEHVVWEASGPIDGDATIMLLLRLFAPEDADPSHRASVAVALDHQPDPAFTWTVGIGAGEPNALTSVGCSPTVSITSAPLTWSVPYSDASRRMEAELSYEIHTVDACGWSVSMAATWFEYSGSHNSAGFSPASISFESIGLVAPAGVRESIVRGNLYKPVELLTAESTASAGTVEHTLALAVDLPDRASPGQYTSTITITVTGDGDPGG